MSTSKPEDIMRMLVASNLDLMAEVAALRLIAGAGIMGNPAAMKFLEDATRNVDDLTLICPFTDEQRAIVRDRLECTLSQVQAFTAGQSST